MIRKRSEFIFTFDENIKHSTSWMGLGKGLSENDALSCAYLFAPLEQQTVKIGEFKQLLIPVPFTRNTIRVGVVCNITNHNLYEER